MKVTTVRIFCVVLACFCFISKADTIAKADTIPWYVSHAPPSVFTDGELKGQGFIDRALALIQQELPQYQHKIISSDIATATSHWQQGKQLCFPALVKTQKRESFVYYTQMSVMHPSNYIAMSPQLAEQKGQATQADLQALLEDGDIYLGVRAGFAFGPVIDELIAKHGLNSTMIFQEEQSLRDLYQLLATNRIDYLIGYPFESAYVLSQLNMQKMVVNLPIKGVPAFSMGAVGCTKNAWGKKVTTDIDFALGRLKRQSRYREALASWLEDVVDQHAFDRFYQEHFLNQ